MNKQILNSLLALTIFSGSCVAADAQTFFEAHVNYVPSVILNYDTVAPSLKNMHNFDAGQDAAAIKSQPKASPHKFFKRLKRKSVQLCDKAE